MLSKPKDGWTTVKIGEFESEASYLVDIPFNWLNACLTGLTNKVPITLFIDEETHYGLEKDWKCMKVLK